MGLDIFRVGARMPDDVLPQEGFFRAQVDRHYDLVHAHYKTAFDERRTPLRAAVSRARRNGSVNLLDVGCGTGRTLFTLGQATARTAHIHFDKIGLTGVNHHDYRGESMDDETNHAVHTRKLRYLVEDATQMDGVPNRSQDVVQANFALMHSTHPEEWVPSLARVLKPGGVLFFDTTLEQLHEKSKLLAKIETDLEDKDYAAHAKVLYVASETESVKRVFVIVQAPGEMAA